MKVYFNSIGVVTSIVTTGDSLRQGSTSVALEAYFDGKNNADYTAVFNYTRHDGSAVAGVLMTLNSSNSQRYDYAFSDPWFFAKAGTTTLTIYLINGSGTIIATGQVQFTIEATDYDADPALSLSEYADLLAKFYDYVPKEEGKSLVADSKVASYDAHLLDTSNPHSVTKAQVGLGNVVNTGDSATPTENGTDKFTNGGAYTLQLNLQSQINNLKAVGRFLSLWNATTGEATTNPPTSPYSYKSGDYFRVTTGGTRIPSGSSYTIGGTNYATSEVTLVPGDVVYYDGTNWSIEAKGEGGADIYDVQVKGVSVVVAGIANITPTSLGLGNVADTGDSDIPVQGGTTKFTTGGAYTELNKKANIMSSPDTSKLLTTDANGQPVVSTVGFNGDAVDKALTTNYSAKTFNVTYHDVTYPYATMIDTYVREISTLKSVCGVLVTDNNPFTSSEWDSRAIVISIACKGVNGVNTYTWNTIMHKVTIPTSVGQICASSAKISLGSISMSIERQADNQYGEQKYVIKFELRDMEASTVLDFSTLKCRVQELV